jgi:hypothetical protein
MVLNNVLYSIDPNTMLLGLLFIIFYVFINFSLSKVFRKERASSTIISLCVALLAVYGINKTSLDISGIFSNIGVSENTTYAVVPWIILGLTILASFAKDDTGKRRFRFYRLFMILGAFFILLSFFAYEQGITMIIGIVLLVLGLLFFWGSKKKDKINSQQGNNKQNSSNGRDALINAAKKFHDWAKHQPNPKFVGSWANFINYLKRGGWGNSESEICQRLNISQNEFVHIFKRHGLV